MIERFAVEQREDAAGSACLRVVRAVDEVPESSVDHRSRTHRAWLERDEHRAVVEPPLAEVFGRIAEGEDLGVADRVALQLAFVVSRRDDDPIVDDDRSYRHIIVFDRRPGLVESASHHLVVGLHGGSLAGPIEERRASSPVDRNGSSPG